mmetsp:Transcript_440/g.292  ORF Transcript_440/g.292 Transcript_440/m.292 type:complete len:92 (-) Transcript_440:11-286(-)
MATDRSLRNGMTVYGLTRLGASLSVLDFVHCGATLSLRSVLRLGSSLSVYGMARLGASVSLLDYLHLGSALAVRSFMRLGSSLSCRYVAYR